MRDKGNPGEELGKALLLLDHSFIVVSLLKSVWVRLEKIK